MAATTGPNHTILVDELLKLLECPVCMKQMAAPIELCVRGHSFCKDCRENVEICPVCRAGFNGCRNFLAEDLAYKCLLPCENVNAGCLQRFSKIDMESHTRSCPYRIYNCSAGTDDECQWTGRRSQLLSHVTTKHSAFLWASVPMQLRWESVTFDDTRYRCFLLSVHGEIFWYYFTVDPVKKTAYQCVQFIGPEEGASEFVYRIEFKSSDGYRELNFQDMTQSDLRDIRSIMESRKCLEWSNGIADNFTDHTNSVHFNLNVHRK